MKFTPLNTIVGVNALLHLAASFTFGMRPGMGGGYGPALGWGILASGMFLIAANIVLSIVFLILASFAKGERAKVLGKCSQGFILSAGVVLLMSVPLCMISFAQA